MMVLTVQRFKFLQQIYRGEYVPNISKSPYAYLSPRYTRGYDIVLSELSRKTGRYYMSGVDSCMWGWVRNPYIDFYTFNRGKSPEDKLYAVFCNVREEDMVMSDYDRFMDYVNGDVNRPDFILDDFVKGECIQCSFWNLSSKNITLIVDLDNIKTGNFVSDMYDERMNDRRFIFNDKYQKFLVG